MMKRRDCLLAFAAAPYLLLTDPLAAAEADEKLFQGDPRLERKVRVEAEGLPLGDLLLLLSQQAGVRLTASSETADDKVVLFTPARPLRETLGDLAALFDDRWSRRKGGEGKPVYELGRDLAARRAEADLLRAERNRIFERAEATVRALSESPEELAKRGPDDPVAEWIWSPQSRQLVSCYAALTQEQGERLFARKALAVPFASLDGKWRQILGDLFTDLNRDLRANDTRPYRGPVDGPIDFDKQTLQFRVLPSYGTTDVALLMRPLGVGRTIVRVDHRKEWQLPAHGNPYSREPVAPGAPLPEARTVSIAAGEKTWPDRLRKLAAATGRPVLADYYRSKLLNQPRSAAAAPPGDPVGALDALCQPVGYLWWTRAETLLLRKRDWFVQQEYEVPDRWLLSVAARLQAQRGLPTYGDVFRVLELSDEQITGLNSFTGSSNIATRNVTTVWGTREALALFEASGMAKSVPIPVEPDEAAPEEARHAFWQSQNQAALRVRDLAPHHQERILALLATAEARGLLVEDKEIETLRLNLCVWPDWKARYQQIAPRWDHPDYQAALVLINGRGSPDYYHHEVYLPCSLPDDRREKTKVEAIGD
jgi:hypothetical protein